MAGWIDFLAGTVRFQLRIVVGATIAEIRYARFRKWGAPNAGVHEKRDPGVPLRQGCPRGCDVNHTKTTQNCNSKTPPISRDRFVTSCHSMVYKPESSPPL